MKKWSLRLNKQKKMEERLAKSPIIKIKVMKIKGLQVWVDKLMALTSTSSRKIVDSLLGVETRLSREYWLLTA